VSAHPERIPQHLQDIADSIGTIKHYLGNCTRDQFDHNKMLQDAVIRRLEIIGEAARRIEKDDKNFISAHPQLQLIKAYGMRNRLSHAYDVVNIDIVWDVAQTSLASMADAITKHLAQKNQ